MLSLVFTLFILRRPCIYFITLSHFVFPRKRKKGAPPAIDMLPP